MYIEINSTVDRITRVVSAGANNQVRDPTPTAFSRSARLGDAL